MIFYVLVSPSLSLSLFLSLSLYLIIFDSCDWLLEPCSARLCSALLCSAHIFLFSSKIWVFNDCSLFPRRKINKKFPKLFYLQVDTLFPIAIIISTIDEGSRTISLNCPKTKFRVIIYLYSFVRACSWQSYCLRFVIPLDHFLRFP